MLQVMNVTNYEGKREEFEYRGKKYNGIKFMNEFDALLEEFLRPYVIDSTSKED